MAHRLLFRNNSALARVRGDDDFGIGYLSRQCASRPVVGEGVRLFGKMFTASMLQLMFDLIGLVLLIVPRIIAILWFMFTPCFVVLEGLGGLTALKRSKAIGQGYNWRNLGIIALLVVIWIVIYIILAVPFVLLFPHAVRHFGGRLFEVIVGSFGTPLTIIGIVLMSYDLRARKGSLRRRSAGRRFARIKIKKILLAKDPAVWIVVSSR